MWWSVGVIAYIVLVINVILFLHSAGQAEDHLRDLEGIPDLAPQPHPSAAQEDSDQKERALQEVG